ncbi:MAG: glycosyltransferase [Hyphomonadaceae bacterium]
MSKILFLITEDWFFRSHFMPLASRARADGHDVVIAARLSGALKDEPGLRVIDTPFARGSLAPWRVGRQVSALRELLAREQPDIVHAIALRPIALLLMCGAARFGRVLAVTGRGYLSVARAPWTRAVDWWLRQMIRRALGAPRTVLAVENSADARWVEGAAPIAGARVVTMPGAGVDIVRFAAAPEAPTPPVVVGIVTRLIWSKGVDLAVEAVRRLRADGLDITLRIAGAADPENPEHVSDAEIARWRAMPGVEVIGKVTDVAAFWAGAHIACLPSRGGEGLPRSLLEAAACGRPIVASDVPGCADLVTPDTGLVVAREDIDALAAALRTLAADASLRARLGVNARARVANGYTEVHAGERAAEAWRLAGAL